MKLTLVMTLGAAISAVQAYRVPVDQEDGVYAVDFDETGTAIVQNLSAVPIVASTFVPGGTGKVQARDFPSQQPHCTNRYMYEHDNYNAASTCLGNFLSNNLGRGGSSSVYYCRIGDMLAAICNYPDTLYGSRDEVANFNGVMDRTCGSWQSGYVWIPDWNKSYWRTTWGESICDNLYGRKQVNNK